MYFIIAIDGKRYGPADSALISQWAAEGRVIATTIVEDATTGARMPASQLEGVELPPEAVSKTIVAPGPASFSGVSSPGVPSPGAVLTAPSPNPSYPPSPTALGFYSSHASGVSYQQPPAVDEYGRPYGDPTTALEAVPTFRMPVSMPSNTGLLSGRLNRAPYLGYTLLISIVTLGLLEWSLSAIGGGDSFFTTFYLILLAGEAASVPISVKRLHDMNRPGWHFWLLFVPIYSWYLSLLMLFERGTPGPNDYGPDPLASGPLKSLPSGRELTPPGL